MSKYSYKQLKEMAEECLVAKGNGNLNYFHLVQVLSMTFRLPPQVVEQKIYELTLLGE